MFDSLSFKPTALIVEDEETQLLMLLSKLEKLGFNVLAGKNGQDGLELWADHIDQIRIVITDINMPLVDGFEVIKTIRAQERYYTYIMVLTVREDKDSVIRALENGADDYVTKPIIQEELALRLNGARQTLRLQDHHDLVSALAELASERSGESGVHLRRTKEYCRIIATDLLKHNKTHVITEQVAEDIANISVLHDIGKQGIPDGLLNKRGRYTPKEFEIIKDHTTIGGELLMKLYRKTGSSFLLLGHEVAMFHHERWDGNGYPVGLQGDGIPLSARIMCFADVFDALLSKRPYKDPMSIAHTESYLKEEKGKHFDPMIVECYERNRDKFLQVHESIKDKRSSTYL
ncbi:HD domain-containing phosphohydrolase [Desulfopila sp. IMCC35008]|uniref:HD domain-containing phosphohydrolase n=1 Tax=Desulfopila sp. IMCC35008 TaxID=2653858 RepID=UPI0013CF5058|nr:HD domain-containing phosphohydrolase [Desulfopila sp. IMCC35008]